MFFRYMEVRDVEEIWEMDQALFGSMAYSRQDFLRAVEGKYDRAIVLMEEEEILGYAILRVLGVEGELESIAVKKKHQGKGFGKQLLREILSIGDREAIQKIFLEVRESNAPARAIYEQEGFRAFSKRKAYYRDPEEDAILMERTIQ